MTIPETWPTAGQPFTTDHLDRMPDDGRWYELLDGVLVVSPHPDTLHQLITGTLVTTLFGAAPDGMFVIHQPAFQLSRTTEFVPDVTVVRRDDIGGAKLTTPPLLVAEIRAPGTAVIDLGYRKEAYAAFGVPSYWIVVPDVRRPELTVFELADGSYEESGHVVGDQRFSATRPFPVEVVPTELLGGLGRDGD